MSLKDSALAVLQRNHERNNGATSGKKTMQLNTYLQANKVAPNELMIAVSSACRGLEITPTQFRAICSEEDLDYIANGSIPMEEIRAYARCFAEGISTGRIVVHPKTQELIRHITACQWWAEQENNTR